MPPTSPTPPQPPTEQQYITSEVEGESPAFFENMNERNKKFLLTSGVLFAIVGATLGAFGIRYMFGGGDPGKEKTRVNSSGESPRPDELLPRKPEATTQRMEQPDQAPRTQDIDAILHARIADIMRRAIILDEQRIRNKQDKKED